MVNLTENNAKIPSHSLDSHSQRTFLKSSYTRLINYIDDKKKQVIIVSVMCLALFISLQPQTFINWWLTYDQQGQILFNLKKYNHAAEKFNNTKWQAYSQYGAENFKQAATLYNQYDDINSTLSRANALAQGRQYVNAKKVYLEVLTGEPDNKIALKNLEIVQKIIDEVNRYSESQQAESEDSAKELGDEPQTGDGADKKLIPQKIEQLTSEQLLLDPKLNEMWLRQVQKNPANFLAQKFYMQKEKSDKQLTPSIEKQTLQGNVSDE